MRDRPAVCRRRVIRSAPAFLTPRPVRPPRPGRSHRLRRTQDRLNRTVRRSAATGQAGGSLRRRPARRLMAPPLRIRFGASCPSGLRRDGDESGRLCGLRPSLQGRGGVRTGRFGDAERPLRGCREDGVVGFSPAAESKRKKRHYRCGHPRHISPGRTTGPGPTVRVHVRRRHRNRSGQLKCEIVGRRSRRVAATAGGPPRDPKRCRPADPGSRARDRESNGG